MSRDVIPIGAVAGVVRPTQAPGPRLISRRTTSGSAGTIFRPDRSQHRPLTVGSQAGSAADNAPPTATIPLVPRAVEHLPAQRWHWSARRRMAQDHPFGRIARIEESLEQLVGELEAEVDRLIARTGELLGAEEMD